jgi:hypothetical protein
MLLPRKWFPEERQNERNCFVPFVASWFNLRYSTTASTSSSLMIMSSSPSSLISVPA